MSQSTISAPTRSLVATIHARVGERVKKDQTILVLEAMKVQTNILAPTEGKVLSVLCEQGQLVDQGSSLMVIEMDEQTQSGETDDAHERIFKVLDEVENELNDRLTKTNDSFRDQATRQRHAKGYLTARENIALLADKNTFSEYGQLAVAAQRNRVDYQTLQETTAADGVITGTAQVNGQFFSKQVAKTVLIVNDYSVLAGTQGFYHHQKIDRMLEIAARKKLPVLMYTEGGGGRPGDVDVTIVNSGLQCSSFSSWAALAGKVPRISVANGYNFAGNAALFGAADITIATQTCWIGMAGPAMIESGGLGNFSAKEIGPADEQHQAGVIDIIVRDETAAAEIAKKVLGFFQGPLEQWNASEQSTLVQHLPESRRGAYQIRKLINQLVDADSFVELRQAFGGAVVVGFARFEGKAIGLLASDCKVLGGAIDVDAAEKTADFIELCNQFSLPIVSLCDTPGFMVGPEHEQRGAARRLNRLFTAGAKFSNTFIAIVLRKCYGLGAQALLGGSTRQPDYIAAWPSGEFGPMGLEGAVKLGFKKELAAEPDPDKQQALYDKLLAEQYKKGGALEVATALEIDAVIKAHDTRNCILRYL